MYSLALDTANSHCSIAIYKNNDLAESRYINTPNMQAKSLASSIQMLMLQAQIKYEELDNIIVTSGPGSFTGVRIGLAYAKGCKIALPNVNVYSLSTLEAIAYSYFYTCSRNNVETKIAVAQNASRGQIYLQIFSLSSHISSPNMQLLNYIEAEEYLVNFNDRLALLGSGAKLIEPSVKKSIDKIHIDEKYFQDNLPNAEMVFEAFSYMQQNQINIQENMSPTYLRPAT